MADKFIRVNEEAYKLTKSVSDLSNMPLKTTASLILSGDCTKILKKMSGDNNGK